MPGISPVERHLIGWSRHDVPSRPHQLALNQIVASVFGAASTIVGAAYLLLGVVGLIILSSDVNTPALNSWDNVLHFVSAALLLAVGVGADKRTSVRFS